MRKTYDMRHLDLFSGIGGFALATEMVWEHVDHTFCEIEPFAQAVLHKHWPRAVIHEDIKTFDGGGCGTVDILTGGFPCQPFSQAGHKKGRADDRDLWPHMFRVIQECRPTWIIGENVAAFVEMELDRSILDLESAGYTVQAFIIPALAVDARHRRDRCWIVAHTDSQGHRSLDRSAEDRGAQTESKSDWQECQRVRPLIGGGSARLADSSGRRRQERQLSVRSGRSLQTSSHTHGNGEDLSDTNRFNGEGGNAHAEKRRSGARRSTRLCSSTGDADHASWSAEPRLGRVAHGVPRRVDRIKALGNAIVPQVAVEIMRAIKAVDNSL